MCAYVCVRARVCVCVLGMQSERQSEKQRNHTTSSVSHPPSHRFNHTHTHTHTHTQTHTHTHRHTQTHTEASAMRAPAPLNTPPRLSSRQWRGPLRGARRPSSSRAAAASPRPRRTQGRREGEAPVSSSPHTRALETERRRVCVVCVSRKKQERDKRSRDRTG